MRTVPLLLAVVVLALAAGIAAGLTLKGGGQPQGWKALLIAGDDAEPAFDNAVDAMARKLAGFGVGQEDVSILKASGDGAPPATRANIIAAFDTLHPGPGEGCFVYITSHGIKGGGLVLADERAYFSPPTLAHLLDGACGERPSVLVLSGCFSGIYASGPLAAPNRTILTAARADRPSFGCNAHLRYTIFDKCLLDSLDRGATWDAVMDRTRTCVSGNEFDLRVNAPSEPQLYVGAKERALRVFP